MENYKTIKELADELHISKQAIWQKIKRSSSTDLRQFMTTKGNTVYVSLDGQNIIKSMFRKNKQGESYHSVDGVDVNVDVSVINEELLFLRGLINQLQDEKKELHKIIDQQQQLTLQANKQIEQLQSQLLLINTTSREEKEVNHLKKELSKLLETNERLQEENMQFMYLTQQKKWWQFWK